MENKKFQGFPKWPSEGLRLGGEGCSWAEGVLPWVLPGGGSDFYFYFI